MEAVVVVVDRKKIQLQIRCMTCKMAKRCAPRRGIEPRSPAGSIGVSIAERL